MLQRRSNLDRQQDFFDSSIVSQNSVLVIGLDVPVRIEESHFLTFQEEEIDFQLEDRPNRKIKQWDPKEAMNGNERMLMS